MEISIKNKLNEKELFRIRRRKEVIETTNPHGLKDYLEIIFLHQGAGVHQIDFNRLNVKLDSLYLVMPGQNDSWELTEIPKGYIMMIQKDFCWSTLFMTFFFKRFHYQFPAVLNRMESVRLLKVSLKVVKMNMLSVSLMMKRFLRIALLFETIQRSES